MAGVRPEFLPEPPPEYDPLEVRRLREEEAQRREEARRASLRVELHPSSPEAAEAETARRRGYDTFVGRLRETKPDASDMQLLVQDWSETRGASPAERVPPWLYAQLWGIPQENLQEFLTLTTGAEPLPAKEAPVAAPPEISPDYHAPGSEEYWKGEMARQEQAEKLRELEAGHPITGGAGRGVPPGGKIAASMLYEGSIGLAEGIARMAPYVYLLTRPPPPRKEGGPAGPAGAYLDLEAYDEHAKRTLEEAAAIDRSITNVFPEKPPDAVGNISRTLGAFIAPYGAARNVAMKVGLEGAAAGVPSMGFAWMAHQDKQEENLANIARDFGIEVEALKFLESDPDDDFATASWKKALEGIAFDAAVRGGILAASRGVRELRHLTKRGYYPDQVARLEHHFPTYAERGLSSYESTLADINAVYKAIGEPEVRALAGEPAGARLPAPPRMALEEAASVEPGLQSLVKGNLIVDTRGSNLWFHGGMDAPIEYGGGNLLVVDSATDAAAAAVEGGATNAALHQVFTPPKVRLFDLQAQALPSNARARIIADLGQATQSAPSERALQRMLSVGPAEHRPLGRVLEDVRAAVEGQEPEFVTRATMNRIRNELMKAGYGGYAGQGAQGRFRVLFGNGTEQSSLSTLNANELTTQAAQGTPERGAEAKKILGKLARKALKSSTVEPSAPPESPVGRLNTIGMDLQQAGEGARWAGEVFEFALRPLRSQILKEGGKKHGPVLARMLDDLELDRLLIRKQELDASDAFQKGIRKMSGADRKALQNAYLDDMGSDFPKIYDIIGRYDPKPIAGQPVSKARIPGLRRAFDDYNDALAARIPKAKTRGIDIPPRKNYLPKYMMDYRRFLKDVGAPTGDIDVMLRTKARAKARGLGLTDAIEIGPGPNYEVLTKTATGAKTSHPKLKLTEDEIKGAISDYMFGGRGGGGKAPFLLERTIRVTPKVRKHYLSLEQAITRSADDYAEAMAEAKIKGIAPGSTKWRNYLIDAARAGELTGEQSRKLTKLFQARLETRPSGPLQKKWRDFVYAATIANPISTVTQMGEWFLNMHRYGVRANVGGTAVTLVDNLPKWMKDAFKYKDKGFSLEGLGLQNVSADLADPSKGVFGTLLNGGVIRGRLGRGVRIPGFMTLSGFRKADFMFKEGNMNAAWLKARRALKGRPSGTRKPSAAYREFLKTAGPGRPAAELKTLEDAILRGDKADPHVTLYIFQELAKTQPLTMSEMTPLYLKHPKARPFLFLKTFQLKQMETARRDTVRLLFGKDVSPQDRARGVYNAMTLATFFGGGTYGINEFKDWLLNRHTEYEGVRVPGTDIELPVNMDNAFNAIFTTTGPFTKYQVTQMGRERDLWENILNVARPPTPVIDNVFNYLQARLVKNNPKKASEELRKAIQHIPGGPPFEVFFAPGAEPGNRPGYEWLWSGGKMRAYRGKGEPAFAREGEKARESRKKAGLPVRPEGVLPGGRLPSAPRR